MKKNANIFNIKLDSEEEELLRSVEAGEWLPVKNLKKIKKDARKAAKAYLQKK